MEENRQVEIKTNNSLKLIFIIIVILLLCLVGFLGYSKLTANKNDSEKTKTQETPKKDEKEETEKLELFNTEVLISDVCPNNKCETDLGEFTLGNKKHKMSIKFAGEIGTDNFESYIKIDDRIKIENEDKNLASFHKIVKIGEDYLAIGIKKGPNIDYLIEIYDKDLILVRKYSSLNVEGVGASEEMVKNYSDYFKVEGNTFTRFTCDTSEANPDGSNQYLEKHLVTIENGQFEDKDLSRVKEYCSAQE